MPPVDIHYGERYLPQFIERPCSRRALKAIGGMLGDNKGKGRPVRSVAICTTIIKADYVLANLPVNNAKMSLFHSPYTGLAKLDHDFR